jgi:hypothetical protein
MQRLFGYGPSYLTWRARLRTGLSQRLQRLRTLLPNMAGQIKDRPEAEAAEDEDPLT